MAPGTGAPRPRLRWLRAELTLGRRHRWLTDARRSGDRQVDDLGDLPACGVVVLAEVGPALVVARLTRPPAGIAADDPVAGGRLHRLVERCVGDHVRERAVRGRWVEQRP